MALEIGTEAAIYELQQTTPLLTLRAPLHGERLLIITTGKR